MSWIRPQGLMSSELNMNRETAAPSWFGVKPLLSIPPVTFILRKAKFSEEKTKKRSLADFLIIHAAL